MTQTIILNNHFVATPDWFKNVTKVNNDSIKNNTIISSSNYNSESDLLIKGEGNVLTNVTYDKSTLIFTKENFNDFKYKVIKLNDDLEFDDDSILTSLRTIEEIEKLLLEYDVKIDIVKTIDLATPTDENVFSAKRTLEEIENAIGNTTILPGSYRYLRKDIEDTASEKITFKRGLESNGDVIIGDNGFASGLTGFGAKIDRNGNGEMESLTLRRFLEVPELRYNRVEVKVGDKWRAPGAGIIESVDTENRIVTLKLEDGEIGAVAVGDICMGIYHSTTTDDNSTEDSDDGKGNRKFAGFCTVYFTITEVSGDRNLNFKYQLRPTSDNWKYEFHPFEMMNFVSYGSFSREDRQTSVYETRTYTRMLRNQNTWEIGKLNIALLYGDMSNLNAFDLDMTGYSIYLNSVYFTGTVTQVAPDGTPVITANDRGEWESGVQYYFYDRVSYKGSLWLCVNEDGTMSEPNEDNNDWLLLVSAGTALYIWIKYADDQYGNGISDSPTGKGFIGIAYNKTSPIESYDPNDYEWSDIRGTEGVPGEPGEDGKTYYTWIAYSDYPDGNPMYQQPNDNTKYIGIAVNKETEIEGTDPSEYTWSKFKGEDGLNGADGVNGLDGTSIIWKGEYSSHPNNPQNGWAYKNTTDKKSYVYQDGSWYLMTVDGIDGLNGKDGMSIVWKGDLTTAPSNPLTNWVYRDANNGRVYIYNGSAWELMVVDGSDGVDGAKGESGLSVYITYNDSETQPSTPTGNGTSNGWHTTATSSAIWMSLKVAASASEGTWGTPIKIKGDDGLYTKFIYKWSVDKPSKPSNVLNPSGWINNIENSSDFTLNSVTGDFIQSGGWYRSPINTDDNLQYISRANFTTTKSNLIVNISVEVSSESNYDYGYVSKLDTAFSTSNYNYRGSGIASQTVSVTVANAGSHYLEFAYTKDSSNSSNEDMFRFKFSTSKLWMSLGIVSPNSTTVEWSDPVLFNGLDGDKGDTGPLGPQGPQGPQGPAGSDGSDGIDGEAGAIARYRGVYDSSTTYIYGYENNTLYRDIVIHNGTPYQVKTKGDSVYNSTPSSSSSRWEKASEFRFVAMDTALIDNANVAGFIFRKIGEGSDGTPYGELRSQSTGTDGNPKLYMNTYSGFLYSVSGTIGGFTISDRELNNSENSNAAINIEYTNYLRFCRINDNSSPGMIDVRSDDYKNAIRVLKYGSSNTAAVEIVSNGSGHALDVYGDTLLRGRPGETIEINGLLLGVRRLNSNTTLSVNDDFIRTTTSLTLTFPSYSSYPGKIFYIKVTGGNVTCSGSRFLPSNNATALSSITLNSGIAYMLISDGVDGWCVFYCG